MSVPKNALATKAAERRAAIIAAASAVFLEEGYESANLSDIMDRAGGSFATLYGQFGDKQGLLLAVLNDRIDAITKSMSIELTGALPINQGLTLVGRTFVKSVLETESLDIRRLLIGLARRFPQITSRYLQLGPDRVIQTLACYLEERAEAGEIQLRDSHQASKEFLELASAGMVNWALLDVSFRPGPVQINRAVDRAVRLFLWDHSPGNRTTI
tara:strand:- start:8213 stop:8854 length:642 start_codon:yes stop_codon:yes gene_type:complete